MTFIDKLNKSVQKNNSLLCVGLDPDISKFPDTIPKDPALIFEFNKAIIDATADLVCCYKPNSAFFEAHGASGIEQLKKTIEYIHDACPDIPVLLDAKRGDIGNTNEHYVQYAFDYLAADAITVHPYLGTEAVEPYFTTSEKGVFVLAKTSNPDSAEFQNVATDGQPMYMRVISGFLNKFSESRNCFFVVGATYPEELAAIRKQVGDIPLLIPGVGAQGGKLEDIIPVGKNTESAGLIISSSRAILYASNGADFAEAARVEALNTKDEINKYR